MSWKLSIFCFLVYSVAIRSQFIDEICCGNIMLNKFLYCKVLYVGNSFLTLQDISETSFIVKLRPKASLLSHWSCFRLTRKEIWPLLQKTYR